MGPGGSKWHPQGVQGSPKRCSRSAHWEPKVANVQKWKKCLTDVQEVSQTSPFGAQAGPQTSKSMKCKHQQLICWPRLWIFMKCQKRCNKPMQNLATSANPGLHIFSYSCLGQGGNLWSGTMGYHGVPWGTMGHHEVPWSCVWNCVWSPHAPLPHPPPWFSPSQAKPKGSGPGPTAGHRRESTGIV